MNKNEKNKLIDVLSIYSGTEQENIKEYFKTKNHNDLVKINEKINIFIMDLIKKYPDKRKIIYCHLMSVVLYNIPKDLREDFINYNLHLINITEKIEKDIKK